MNVDSFPSISGPLLITPKLFNDSRGFFYESWNHTAWLQMLEKHQQAPQCFVQDNQSRSSRHVLRGLHWQKPPHAQAKLVRCLSGEIYDVAVDLRRHSPSFGQWIGICLSASNHRQLWIPTGFAHGFLTLSEFADVLYKTTDQWDPACERSLRWDDPSLAIAWPNTAQPRLSEKDAVAPYLNQLQSEDLF